MPGLSWPDPDEARFAFPEKYLAARVRGAGIELELHDAHLPHGAGRGQIKVHAYEAIRRRVDQAGPGPVVLCGDFNAPIAENEDGPLPDGDPDDPWTVAETALLTNPRLRDVYRDVHETGRAWPGSYYTRARVPGPRRYDFIFASAELRTIECRYLTDWLEKTDERKPLSDHAPVEAVLALD